MFTVCVVCLGISVVMNFVLLSRNPALPVEEISSPVKALIESLEFDDGWKFVAETNTVVSCYRNNTLDVIFTFQGNAIALNANPHGGMTLPFPVAFSKTENLAVKAAVQKLQTRTLIGRRSTMLDDQIKQLSA
jgi:hypothetical protein